MNSIDIQTYLVYYDWDFYFDENHNIHIELDEYYFDQKELLFEVFEEQNTLFLDSELKEIVLILNN